MNERNTTPARVHHPYSPSTLQTREACPKWQPTSGTNEAAEIGSLQHDAAEARLDDPRLSDARAEAVAQCVAFTDDLASKFPGCTVLKEQYMPVDDEKIRVRSTDYSGITTGPRLPYFKEFLGTTAGYADFCLVTADGLHGEVVDYKFGQHGVEEAVNNLQGIAYSLGLLKKYPTITDCTVTFLLPHRDEISQHTFDLTDAAALLLRVKTIVHRAIECERVPNDFSRAFVTVSACSFCGLLGVCPKVAEIALNVGRKYRPAEIPDSVTPTTLSDPAQVGLGLQIAMMLKTWAEAYRAQATAKSIEDEHFMPAGYKLVTATRRTVRNARVVAEAAKALLPADQHEMVESLFEISLTPLEKLITAVAPRGSKAEAVEKFAEAILTAGGVEESAPYAFLRMNTAKKKNET
jgi:hypothetical protein